MKTFLSIIILLCSHLCVMADGEVVLYEDQEYNHTGHKFVVPPITVEDNNDEVTITSDSTQTVGVVVRGTDGSLMYVGVVNASKMGTSIYIPSSTLTDKFTIDIYTDDRHLTGLKYYTPSLRMEL